jgi:Tfp pilus assembly protein PilP
MKEDRLRVRISVALMGLVLLLGCEDSVKTIPKPQVVHKKIVSQANSSQTSSNVATVEQTQVNAPHPETQEPLAQTKPEVPPAPAVEPTSPPKPMPLPPPSPTGMPVGPAISTPAEPVVSNAVARSSLAKDSGKNTGSSAASANSKMEALLPSKVPEPYSAKGKPDPFEPLLRDETVSKTVALKSKKRVPSTPLEMIEIGQLKLVAIIAAAKENIAMVQESSGKGYIIRPGTLIGTNSGKVISIETDKVLFEEEYEDFLGKTVVQKKEITLPKPPGEL